MRISEILTPEDEVTLTTKVLKEFRLSENHTSSWRNKTENIIDEYLFPEAEKDSDNIKIRSVWNNLRIRKSVFLSDNIQVINVPMNGVFGSDTAKNCNKVFEANFRSMDIRLKYEEVLDDDGLLGVGCLAVDGWNDHNQEPIVSYINSRVVYADPKNWRGNAMRWCGTFLRKSIYELQSDIAYDKDRIELVKMQRSVELQSVDRGNSGRKYTEVENGDDLIDIYNHITIFKSSKDKEFHKYLITFGADKTTIIRAVRMKALTDLEKADPSKISLGIQLFRSNPIKGQFAGASIILEIGQYQDLETLLTNLKTEQAKEIAIGGPTFVDTSLGIDTDQLSNKSAAGAYVDVTSTNPNINAQNGVILSPVRPQNPAVENHISMIQQLAQQATNVSQLAQGQSLSGTQTKSEVQTIQQNINQVLSYMGSNLMDALQGLWEDIYKSYAANMSSQRKKNIVVVDVKGGVDSYGFKKNEFISDGEFYILIKSKSQEELKKQKNFAIRLSIHSAIAPFLEPGSVESKIWNRELIADSGISSTDPTTIIGLTADERVAYSNLELLNNDIPLKTKPQSGEDHVTRLNIYKTGLQTKARDKAIELLELIIEQEPKQALQAQGGTGGVANMIGASMVASNNAKNDTSSLADIKA